MSKGYEPSPSKCLGEGQKERNGSIGTVQIHLRPAGLWVETVMHFLTTDHNTDMRDTIVNPSQVAQLVGVSSHTPKRLWVPCQVRAHA